MAHPHNSYRISQAQSKLISYVMLQYHMYNNRIFCRNASFVIL